MQDGWSAADEPWIDFYPSGAPASLTITPAPISRLLDDAAIQFPSVPAIVFGGTRTSYRELTAKVDGAAAALLKLGVTSGDPVSLVLPNCPQLVTMLLACARIGAVAALHQPAHGPDTLGEQLREVRAGVVVALDMVARQVREAVGPTPTVLSTSLVSALGRRQRLALAAPTASGRAQKAQISVKVATSVAISLEKETGGAGERVRRPVDPTSAAVVVWTSGADGPPKAVSLSHSGLMANVEQLVSWWPQAAPGREVVVGVLPLCHSYGLVAGLLLGLRLGSTVLLQPRFDLVDLLELCREWTPTVLPAVPALLRALVDSPATAGYDLSSIRLTLSSTSPLAERVRLAAGEILGGPVLAAYGLTECGPLTHVNPGGSPTPSTMGLPLPGTECRVIALDGARELGVGKPGELWLRGPQTSGGYPFDKPATDNLVTDEGWLRSGDVVTMDQEGRFTLVARRSQLIRVPGGWVTPARVEAAILALPQVEDVCVVDLGEAGEPQLRAHVLVRPDQALGAGTVAQHCHDLLPDGLVPQTLVLSSSLPRTLFGAVDRRAVLAMPAHDVVDVDQVLDELDRRREQQAAGRAADSRQVAPAVARARAAGSAASTLPDQAAADPGTRGEDDSSEEAGQDGDPADQMDVEDLDAEDLDADEVDEVEDAAAAATRPRALRRRSVGSVARRAPAGQAQAVRPEGVRAEQVQAEQVGPECVIAEPLGAELEQAQGGPSRQDAGRPGADHDGTRPEQSGPVIRSVVSPTASSRVAPVPGAGAPRPIGQNLGGRRVRTALAPSPRALSKPVALGGSTPSRKGAPDQPTRIPGTTAAQRPRRTTVAPPTRGPRSPELPSERRTEGQAPVRPATARPQPGQQPPGGDG